MQIVSIDIETTGLDPENCQVLSIGAVIEDSENIQPLDELPRFHGVILPNRIEGEPYAINLNRDLIQTIVYYQTAESQDEKNDLAQMSGMQFYTKDSIAEAFYYWLYENGVFSVDNESLFKNGGHMTLKNGKMAPVIGLRTKPAHITVAGKNFATFDLKFLERLPRWKQLIKVRQRVLDPTILYIDWKEDDSPPSMSTCKKRAGLPPEITHNAVEDALDVIMLLRAAKLYHKY